MVVAHVLQEDDYGCGVAALAMILGKSYCDTKAMFSEIDLSKRGLHVDDVLADLGFAMATKQQYRQWSEDGRIAQSKRNPWPPLPFADLHLCKVVVSESSNTAHWVVMLGDGRVLDPLTTEPRSLSDYASVYWVSAVVRYAEAPE